MSELNKYYDFLTKEFQSMGHPSSGFLYYQTNQTELVFECFLKKIVLTETDGGIIYSYFGKDGVKVNSESTMVKSSMSPGILQTFMTNIRNEHPIFNNNLSTPEKKYSILNKYADEYTYEKAGKDVMIGMCGFAWINITITKKMEDDFIKYLIANNILKSDKRTRYNTTYRWWIGGFNQSILHKENYADKMVELLKFFGYSCYYNSRLD